MSLVFYRYWLPKDRETMRHGEIEVDDEINLGTASGWAMLQTAIRKKHPRKTEILITSIVKSTKQKPKQGPVF